MIIVRCNDIRKTCGKRILWLYDSDLAFTADIRGGEIFDRPIGNRRKEVQSIDAGTIPGLVCPSPPDDLICSEIRTTAYADIPPSLSHILFDLCHTRGCQIGPVLPHVSTRHQEKAVMAEGTIQNRVSVYDAIMAFHLIQHVDSVGFTYIKDTVVEIDTHFDVRRHTVIKSVIGRSDIRSYWIVLPTAVKRQTNKKKRENGHYLISHENAPTDTHRYHRRE